MSLSPERRGDLAEQMLPTAAHLSVLVHGDGGPEDIAAVLDSLDDTAKNALIVVLAGMVDPDQSVGKALGWLDFDEHGRLTVPASWSEERSVRDLVPEPEVVLDDDFVDQVAVAKFVKGFRVDDLSDAEFLAAVRQCVARGMSLGDVDKLRRWPAKTTEKRVNRLRKQHQRSGRTFPPLGQVQRVFTEDEVVAIRERSAAGASDRDLAMSFDVRRETIRSIVNGTRYARFGGPIRERRSARGLQASRDHMCGHGANSVAAKTKTQIGEAA